MQINLKFSSRQTGHQANILEFPRQLFYFSSLTRWTNKKLTGMPISAELSKLHLKV